MSSLPVDQLCKSQIRCGIVVDGRRVKEPRHVHRQSDVSQVTGLGFRVNCNSVYFTFLSSFPLLITIAQLFLPCIHY